MCCFWAPAERGLQKPEPEGPAPVTVGTAAAADSGGEAGGGGGGGGGADIEEAAFDVHAKDVAVPPKPFTVPAPHVSPSTTSSRLCTKRSGWVILC